jgi:Domain of unknown function (DUF4166)
MELRKTSDTNILRFPAPRTAAPPAADDALGDLRFRKLLGAAGWRILPAAVRARFSKRLSGTKTAIYTGEILETRMSTTGWLFAQAARLIGAPLPVCRDVGVPAVVSVTEDEASGGQLWTRQYGKHAGFPHVIHSAKRFDGPTGLEEYVGCGIGMTLTVDADDTALHFRSVHYFFKALGVRVVLPRFLSPGQTTVSHIDLGHGAFAFVLDVTHPWFGELIHQVGYFKDMPTQGAQQ